MSIFPAELLTTQNLEKSRCFLPLYERELEEIAAGLRDRGLVALEGDYGSGKTALALRYTERYADRYPGGVTLCGTYHDFQDAIEAWGRQGFPGQQHLVVADELTGLAHQTPELEKFLNRFYELLRYIDSGGPMAVLMIGNPVPEELARRCRHVRLGPLSVEDLDKLISQWRNWMGRDGIWPGPQVFQGADGNLRKLLTALELLRETGGPARRLETLPTLLGADGRPLSANSGAFRHIRVDLSCANEELLRLVRERPEEMYRMRPAEFEGFVAALLARMGYQVTRTPLTHDGGVDVVAVRKAGLGSFLFDITGGWFSSAGVTLITKGLMAVICGAIAWSGKEQKISRLIVAAVTGSLSYCVMYLGYSFFELLISGSAPDAAAIAMMTKAGATLFNAVVADVIAVPLFLAIRGALQRSHLWRGGKPGAAM